MNYLGDFKASSSVNFNFTTHAASGASVAPSNAFEAADLIVYKGSSATQRTSAAGITMTSPFDSIVGLHHVTIDLSDNTDAGFWAAGNDYFVVLSPDTETVDALTVVKEVASFSIENRVVNWAQVVSPTTTNALTGTSIAITQKVDIETIKTQAVTAGAGVTVLASVGTAATSTAQTGDSYARIGAPVGASISADIVVIDNFVDDLESRLTSTRAGYLDNLSAGVVPTAAESAAALLDLSNGIETGYTPKQALRLILAALAGKMSGGGTATVVFRAATDAKDRITATVDASGNRSAITLDGT